ncbi:MAG: hypothetical protein L0196_04370 [candidate division Zixibacteria bacterium]|nr:hypothetical protein [candidate division Zixibacteria bacterium]
MSKYTFFSLLGLYFYCLPAVGMAQDEPEKEVPWRLHGYGELHFNHPKSGAMSQAAGDEIDIHRWVIGLAYEFSDRIRMDMELDFEHAFNEPEFEYGYLEFDLTPTLSARVGSVLMPVGPLNEFHEPPLFYSVERPYTEASLIPTTWQENGAGLVGRFMQGKVAFRAYATAGLDAYKFTTLDGLRKGRSKSVKSKIEDWAGVGRVEVSPNKYVTLATSGYVGGADQSDSSLGYALVKIWEGDLKFKYEGFELSGTFLRTEINGAERVSAVTGDTIGSAMQGGYVEAAYRFKKLFFPEGSRADLALFARYERFNTNHEVPAGYTADKRALRRIFTTGLAFYPLSSVVLKADGEFWKDGTDDKVERLNLGAGFMF